MAKAVLNPQISVMELDKSTPLYKLYKKLYDGMTEANSKEAPDFVDEATVGGVLNDEKLEGLMKSYSELLMKNSAFMFAKAIIDEVGELDDTDYLPLSGGTVSGSLIIENSASIRNTLKIGGAILSWDPVHECLVVDKSFYSLGQIFDFESGAPTVPPSTGDSNKVYLTQDEYDALVEANQIIPYVEYNVYEEV